MAIFEINDNKVSRVRPTEFKLEKDLQDLVEQNLETFFNYQRKFELFLSIPLFIYI